MESAIRHHASFIVMFRSSGHKLVARRKLLEDLTLSQVKVFVELAKNTLFGILPITEVQKNSLTSIKPLIQVLVSSRVPLRDKKKALIDNPKGAFKLVNILYEGIRKLIWEK